MNAYSAEIQSEVKLTPSQAEYQEGEIVEVEINIWPIENAELSELQKLEGISLFGVFRLAKINSIGISENNADVVQVKASAIVLYAKNIIPSTIQYKDILINLPIPNVKIKEIKNKTENFIILEQAVDVNYKKVIVATLGILFIAIGIYLYKKRKKPENPKVIAQKYYSQLFSNAENRKDFEEIYAMKKEWIPLLEAETNAHREFFKLMELHQYKKDWTVDEANEIKNIFGIIRGSF